ncbi:MAG: metal-dependent hydrolase, partial [Rhodothermales bacterium]|nr:metal-dependent hydrolase [Rhodothermales bacterium]
MDSITQAALGAAVGEAVLGRQVGNRAPLWGAVIGTVPDLDIVAYPLLSEPAALAWHRGVSHALLVAALVAPAVGLCVSRIYRDGRFRGWTRLGFFVYVTHPLLDACTVYGTQLLQPFSDVPLAYPIVFIIDPLYTLPLLAGIAVVLFLRREARARRVAIGAALALSTAYLGWAAGVKQHVDAVVEA